MSLNVLFWVLFVRRSHASLKHSPSHLQIADYEAAAAVGSTSWMKRNEWKSGTLAHLIGALKVPVPALLLLSLISPETRGSPFKRKQRKQKLTFPTNIDNICKMYFSWEDWFSRNRVSGFPAP